jgi:hypothetical protein
MCFVTQVRILFVSLEDISGSLTSHLREKIYRTRCLPLRSDLKCLSSVIAETFPNRSYLVFFVILIRYESIPAIFRPGDHIEIWHWQCLKLRCMSGHITSIPQTKFLRRPISHYSVSVSHCFDVFLFIISFPYQMDSFLSLHLWVVVDSQHCHFRIVSKLHIKIDSNRRLTTPFKFLASH